MAVMAAVGSMAWQGRGSVNTASMLLHGMLNQAREQAISQRTHARLVWIRDEDSIYNGYVGMVVLRESSVSEDQDVWELASTLRALPRGVRLELLPDEETTTLQFQGETLDAAFIEFTPQGSTAHGALANQLVLVSEHGESMVGVLVRVVPATGRVQSLDVDLSL